MNEKMATLMVNCLVVMCFCNAMSCYFIKVDFVLSVLEFCTRFTPTTSHSYEVWIQTLMNNTQGYLATNEKVKFN